MERDNKKVILILILVGLIMMTGEKKEAAGDVIITRDYTPASVGFQMVQSISTMINANNNLQVSITVQNTDSVDKTYLIEITREGFYTGALIRQSQSCDLSNPYARHTMRNIPAGATETFVIEVPTTDVINKFGYGTYDFRVISYDMCCFGGNPCQPVSPFYDSLTSKIVQVEYTDSSCTCDGGYLCGESRSCTISGCAGTQTCNSGTWSTCVQTDPNCGTCTNDCTSGQTRCLDASTKQTCGNYDADPCTEWGGNVNCPTGCSGVQCISTNFETIESAVKDGNRIKAHFEIKNTGPTTETFIVEAQVDYQYKKRTQSLQQVCDVSCQNNAYKQVTIIPGATEIFDIILLNNYANLPNGEYFVKAISVNQCCKNGCVDKGPYGQVGKIIGQNIVITSGTQPYDLCPTVYCGDGECSIGEDSASCPTDCNSCTPWVNGACGAGDCWLSGFRPRTRQCTPPNSGETSDCLYDTNCEGECTSDTDCTAYSGECTIGKCSVAKKCDAQNKADGTACTGGTCQSGICTPSNCGNGAINTGEECDGTNMNSKTCSSLGYSGGNLVCTSSCKFDKSGCTSTCDKLGGSCESQSCDSLDMTSVTGASDCTNCCKPTPPKEDWMKYLWIFGGFMLVALMFKVMGSSKK